MGQKVSKVLQSQKCSTHGMHDPHPLNQKPELREHKP